MFNPGFNLQTHRYVLSLARFPWGGAIRLKDEQGKEDPHARSVSSLVLGLASVHRGISRRAARRALREMHRAMRLQILKTPTPIA